MINKKFQGFLVGIPNPIVVLSEAKRYPKLDKYKNSGIIFNGNKNSKF